MRITEITSPAEKINNAQSRKYDAQYKMNDKKDAAKDIKDPAKRANKIQSASKEYQKTLNTQNRIQNNAQKAASKNISGSAGPKGSGGI